jgi:hypothetical protein
VFRVVCSSRLDMNSNAIQDTKIPENFDSDEKSGHLLGAVATA